MQGSDEPATNREAKREQVSRRGLLTGTMLAAAALLVASCRGRDDDDDDDDDD